jgi:hypothetical protein
MRDFIDIAGASGVSYRFSRLREGRPLSPMGGNYAYVRFTGDRFELIYVGESQNLLRSARDHWDDAADRFQVRELFTRLNISERVRQKELADIVAASSPPMNAETVRKAE